MGSKSEIKRKQREDCSGLCGDCKRNKGLYEELNINDLAYGELFYICDKFGNINVNGGGKRKCKYYKRNIRYTTCKGLAKSRSVWETTEDGNFRRIADFKWHKGKFEYTIRIIRIKNVWEGWK